MGKWHYFSDKEVEGLDPELVSKLDSARHIAGVPFRLTSTTGGNHTPGSEHYKGFAVDIGLGHLADGFERNTQRWAIMKGLFLSGFQRIEDCPLHIHVGIGTLPDYPSPTMWIGKDE